MKKDEGKKSARKKKAVHKMAEFSEEEEEILDEMCNITDGEGNNNV